ncbi:hypothetical protein [Pseudomonas sp. JV241A]|jgi:hypothetical protein|uniref:hypothetical protein n=1 Tax=Pseudomonas sp. JV241A TaxID=2078785 RepID=UPI00100CDDBB|nr:hypothetical protein [Pseudomonas sp. JV241A]SPO66447.1 protein of unknown function [Pseudomonas sp. JV241A]
MTFTHYAMIEDIVLDGSRTLAVLDCITRNAVDQLSYKTWSNVGPNNEYLQQTLLLTVDIQDLTQSIVWRNQPTPLYRGFWLKFTLDHTNTPPPENAVVAEFLSLAELQEQTSHRFTLTGIRAAQPQLQQLAYLHGLSADEATLHSVLDAAARQAGTSRWVVAYDIGQGNANALIDVHGHPCLFYDLGWPTSSNACTRPADRPALLIDHRCCNDGELFAPVVLSHWDFDHWGYAVGNMDYNFGLQAANMVFKPEAMSRPWIIPQPPPPRNNSGLGPSHLRFFAHLYYPLVWPNSLEQITFSAGTITRTDPSRTPHNRNNQGLAWFVMDYPNCAAATLLPGDIEYDKIRWPDPRPDLVSLVASHHGGRAGMPPAASTLVPAHLTLSLGQDNTHHHPSPVALANHARMGWPAPIVTKDRTRRAGSGLTSGSVLIPLDPAAVKPSFGCTQLISSNLVPTQ